MKFTLDEAQLRNAVDMSLQEGARILVDEIVQVTPRDPNRLPNNPKAKVTGNLRRSIDFDKVDYNHYRVGVIGAGIEGSGVPISVGKGATPAEYGYYQEFGTVRMKPRSFIRKTLFEKGNKIVKEIQNIFNRLITN